MPMTFEQQVAYLFDKDAVTATVSRFFFALDDKDWDAAGSCLTDPFTMLVPNSTLGDRTLAGNPVELQAFVQRLEERNGGFTQTLHVHPNAVVTMNGDEAHFRSFMIVPHSVGPAEDDTFWSWGFYDIDLIRTGNDWKMRNMVIDGRIRNRVDPAEIYRRAADRFAASASATAANNPIN